MDTPERKPIAARPAGVVFSDGSFQTWDEWEKVNGPGRPVIEAEPEPIERDLR